jgi:hypothetical protein
MFTPLYDYQDHGFIMQLRNIKQPRMSICCDINTMGVIEHKRSLGGRSFCDFLSGVQLPECLYHSISTLYTIYYEVKKCASAHSKSLSR